MANVQLAVAGDETTQVILSVPGVQGPAGSNLPPSGTTNQVLYKQSSTDYDTAWSLVTSAMITDGTIVNGDINASAAIAGTKISPDFGSQNVVTTGTATAASFIPTSSGVPSNGLYLPSANNVAISTGGSGRLFVDASGNVGVGTDSLSRNFTVRSASTIVAASLVSNPANIAYLLFGDTDADAQGRVQYNNSTDSLELYSAGSERLRITSTGTVNIKGAGSAGSTQAVSFNGSAPVDSLVLTSGGRVGIGTASPAKQLHIEGTSSDVTLRIGRNGYVQTDLIGSTGAGANDFKITQNGFDRFVIEYGGNSAARIDSSGRLLVGTPSARGGFDNNSGVSSNLQVEGAGTAAGGTRAALSIVNNGSADADSAGLYIARSGGTSVGSFTAVTADDILGRITFSGADGSEFVQGASIEAVIDGTPGADDMPGRLVFSVTRDGSASPTEAMRISNSGKIDITSDQGVSNVVITNTNASFASTGLYFAATRAANSVYDLLAGYSSGTSDAEFRARGDGNTFCDGAFTGGGADYAEYFEWSDSNSNAEDRRGISVVLDGDKIREAQAGEDPIGVISGNPSVVGDAAWNKWSGKYLRDEYGTYILDANGDRQLNSAYDPDVEYISREERPEWDCVGLMGKLRIRKGQVIGSRWIKMRDISNSVEEWLVR